MPTTAKTFLLKAFTDRGYNETLTMAALLVSCPVPSVHVLVLRQHTDKAATVRATA